MPAREVVGQLEIDRAAAVRAGVDALEGHDVTEIIPIPAPGPAAAAIVEIRDVVRRVGLEGSIGGRAHQVRDGIHVGGNALGVQLLVDALDHDVGRDRMSRGVCRRDGDGRVLAGLVPRAVRLQLDGQALGLRIDDHRGVRDRIAAVGEPDRPYPEAGQIRVMQRPAERRRVLDRGLDRAALGDQEKEPAIGRNAAAALIHRNLEGLVNANLRGRGVAATTTWPGTPVCVLQVRPPGGEFRERGRGVDRAVEAPAFRVGGAEIDQVFVRRDGRRNGQPERAVAGRCQRRGAQGDLAGRVLVNGHDPLLDEVVLRAGLALRRHQMDHLGPNLPAGDHSPGAVGLIERAAGVERRFHAIDVRPGEGAGDDDTPARDRTRGCQPCACRHEDHVGFAADLAFLGVGWGDPDVVGEPALRRI